MLEFMIEFANKNCETMFDFSQPYKVLFLILAIGFFVYNIYCIYFPSNISFFNFDWSQNKTIDSTLTFILSFLFSFLIYILHPFIPFLIVGAFLVLILFLFNKMYFN